ncbi:MAG: 8-amino-7-oxononanoate synthase, partial [Gemmatimonadota bacterium]|nr:8-amino-7-oxononanoate synthase [Gemmatimonadota bacterium]
ALLFSSGYAAAVGIIPALASRGDSIYIDRLCHASLYDGALLSRAVVKRFRHCDTEHLAGLLRKEESRGAHKILVLTDTVFSMDGDRARLAELAQVCKEHGALLLADEAHAVGVLGPQGRGLAAEAGLDSSQVFVLGTLGKAFGVSGAYVATSRLMRDYFINSCRSFIFSTSVPPPVVGAVGEALAIIRGADTQRRRLLEMAEKFRARLESLGLDTLGSTTQIVPALVGEPEWALEVAENFRKAGVFVPAVRPPTVPEGSSRVRFSLTSALTDEDFSEALEAVSGVLGQTGIF